jgi:hypothetical protein
MSIDIGDLEDELSINESMYVFSDGLSISYNCNSGNPVTLYDEENDEWDIEFTEEYRNVLFSDESIILKLSEGVSKTIKKPVTVGKVMDVMIEHYSSPISDERYLDMTISGEWKGFQLLKFSKAR